jgi:hypothetical protein
MYVSKTIIKNTSPSLQVIAQNRFIDIKKISMADVEQIFDDLP